MAKRVKEPSHREIMASIRKITAKQRLEQEEFTRQVLAIFREAEWGAAHTSGAGTMPGDLIATRAELGRERRYLIDVVIEINPPRLNRSYENFRHFVRSRKEPFSEFDEYWLVGQYFIGDPMRKNPNNDRHFRALDLKQLRELLAIPDPKKAGNGKATTKIGKAVEVNEKEITLTISGLILQIDEKLEKMRGERPNSDEAKARAAGEISELERMKAELKKFVSSSLPSRKGRRRRRKSSNWSTPLETTFKGGGTNGTTVC